MIPRPPISTRTDTPLPDPTLFRSTRHCLEARGGEFSARMRAAALARIYLEQGAEGRNRFLTVISREFAVSGEAVDAAVEHYRAAAGDAERMQAESELRRALQPPRLRLLTQFNGQIGRAHV